MNEQSLFADVLDIPDPAERAAYLDRVCGADTALRRRLDRLLERHRDAGSFLGRSPLTPDETVSCAGGDWGAEDLGTSIGPYKLLEVIGQGGMGVVYMADQSEPVKRRVALKVIKPGMDSKAVVARFEAERQALAVMDHPHIARVFDGGTTPSVRPYFVMELVRGLPITEYCDEARLSVPERLALFVQVCRAVQHAHQKGVIHRDLKPSNVLVTEIDGRPVPKVIDFGIAKATSGALTDRTLFTGFHQLVGTPLYMAPEQTGVSGVDVDTRADVYSLGVLLYELLTGTTPFDGDALRKAGFNEMRRIIREDEPDRPSRRVSTLAVAQSSTISERRKLDPRRLARLVRSELDWVVMTALEKDRNRRYESANAFAADVERYLADEPVQAAPPSAAYRVRKFARRNRRAMATAAVLAVAVLSVIGVIGWGMWDRSSRRMNAETAAIVALEESAEHYRADRPDAAMASAKRAVDTLAGISGAERLLADAYQRVTDLEMLERLEELYLVGSDQGTFDVGQVVATAYRDAFRRYGIDPAELTVAEAVGRIRGRLIARELVAGLEKWRAAELELGPEAEPTRSTLLRIASDADADPWSRRVREVTQGGTPDQKAALATEIANAAVSPQVVTRIGRALVGVDRRAQAEALLRQAARTYPDQFELNFNLGELLIESSSDVRRLEALGYLQAALASRPRSSSLRNKIGKILTDGLGRPAEGAEWFRAALLRNPDYHLARSNLSVALNKSGDRAAAVTVAQECVARTPSLPAYWCLGNALRGAGDEEGSKAAFRTVVEFVPRTAEEHSYRGHALTALGQPDDAIAAYRQALRLRPTVVDLYGWLGQGLSRKGADAEAIEVYRRGLRVAPDNARYHNSLAVLLRRRGQFAEAVVEYREAARLDPTNADYPANLGKVLNAMTRLDEAVVAYQVALWLRPNNASIHYDLGIVYARLDRLTDAIREYESAIKLDPNLAEAHCNLGKLHLRAERYSEALPLLQRGHDLGSKSPKWRYPSRLWVESARRLIALEPQLPAILAGQLDPKEPADAIEVAPVAARRKRFARAVELYRMAFAATPSLAELASPSHRYDAACAAAVAGCGTEADKLDDAGRANLRAQSLAWLKAELTDRRKRSDTDTGPSPGRQALLASLSHWQHDRDLAGVRDAAELAKLPDAERVAWKAFWAEVQALADEVRPPGTKAD